MIRSNPVTVSYCVGGVGKWLISVARIRRNTIVIGEGTLRLQKASVVGRR